ncbi:MAG TPA: hypothetical protein VFH27_07775 [Longimicrobiaceae bacterium]|nr:hypothetical protein [Longimicrobiaceae bacterium]
MSEAVRPYAEVRRGRARQSGAHVVIAVEGGAEIPLEFRLWPGGGGNARAGTVWVLPRGAGGLGDRLREGRESFVDVGGAVFLSFPQLIVDRANLKLPQRAGAPSRSFDAFADRSSLVVRTLLEAPDHGAPTWGVRQLAEAAGVSPATSSRVVGELRRYGLVTVRRSGRESEITLADARGLFTLWTGAYQWRANHSIAVGAPIGDPLRFLHRSRSAFGSRRWALTLQSGAALVAPHASWDRIHAYVDVDDAAELVDIASEQGWPLAPEGRLVLMKPFYRDSVWHGVQEVTGLPVVSDLQLALDLWHYPVRGREQAEHLLKSQHLLER